MSDDRLPAHEVIELASFAAQKGWVPATTGNFSVRTPNGFAITASGFDKGALTPAMILQIDANGQTQSPGARPSAECPIHQALYQWDKRIQAIAHTHSLPVTVYTQLLQENIVQFTGYEIGKVFPEIASHHQTLRMPLFANSQDMPTFAHSMVSVLKSEPFNIPAIAIVGHGITVWGDSVANTKRHLEALEFLFACELAKKGAMA